MSIFVLSVRDYVQIYAKVLVEAETEQEAIELFYDDRPFCVEWTYPEDEDRFNYNPLVKLVDGNAESYETGVDEIEELKSRGEASGPCCEKKLPMRRFLMGRYGKQRLVYAESPEAATEKYWGLPLGSVIEGSNLTAEATALPDAPENRVRFLCRLRDIPKAWRGYVSSLRLTRSNTNKCIAIECIGLPERYYSQLNEAEAIFLGIGSPENYLEYVTTARLSEPAIVAFRYSEYEDWKNKAADAGKDDHVERK